MVFFSRLNKKSIKIITEVTTISRGTTIENGRLNLSSDLIIEGEYSGSIETTKKVIVGKSGIVRGCIVAEDILLDGIIEGEVDCSAIEVQDGAKISGKVVTGRFVIGDGGIFEGIIKNK